MLHAAPRMPHFRSQARAGKSCKPERVERDDADRAHDVLQAVLSGDPAWSFTHRKRKALKALEWPFKRWLGIHLRESLGLEKNCGSKSTGGGNGSKTERTPMRQFMIGPHCKNRA